MQDSTFPNLLSPFDAYAQKGRWAEYVRELRSWGLLWLLRQDLPRLVYHLIPLNSRPEDIELPLVLEFLAELLEPTITPERVEYYLDLFERQEDWEAAGAAAAVGTGLVYNMGNDYTGLVPWHHRVEALLKRSDIISAPALCALYLSKGSVEFNSLFDLTAATQSFTQALEWADRSGDNTLKLLSSSHLGYALMHTTNFSRLEVLFMDAAPLRELPDISYEALAAFNGIFGLVLGTVDPESAIAILTDTVNDPDFTCVQPGTWLITQGHLMYTAIQNGLWGLAAEAAKMIREFAIPEHNHCFHAYAHFNLAIEAVATGERMKAQIHQQETIRRLRLCSCPIMENVTNLSMVQVLIETGQTDKALGKLDRIKEVSAVRGHNLVRSGVELELASLYAGRNKMSKARAHYEKARELFQGRDPLHPTRLRSFERSLKQILYPGENGSVAMTESPAPVVRVNTLGDLNVEYHNHRVDGRSWRGRTTKSLLKALVAFGGTISNEKLMDMLWPETDGDKASQNLKVTIYRLRKVLDFGDGGAPPWISVTQGRVSLRRDICRVDTFAFQSALNKALKPGGGFDDLAKALDMYNGNFLQDDKGESFVVAYRETLCRQFIDGVEALARLDLADGNPGRSLPYLQKAAAADPLSENVCEWAMRVLLAMGQASLALRAFDHTRSIIKQQLGIEPGETLLDLARQAGRA